MPSKPDKPNRPTMHDVAAEAGVSQMTVSRVMRNDGYISSDVRQRVADAAARLGYIHNRLASVQRGIENPMVGVVLPTLKNAVFIDVLAGINDSLALHDIRPVFGVSEYSEAAEEELVTDMLAWQPCGLILTGLEHSEGLRKAVASTSVRVAEIMDVEGTAMSASFGISQQTAGADMARHLLARGYKRIAYLGSQGGQDLRAGKRLDAFREVLREGGAEMIYQRVAKRPSSMLLGRDLTARCLSEASNCDAIYFSNDDLAAGGLMHCLSEGIDVPGNVALAGFNGLPFLDALPLKITTTRTPLYEIGAKAARFVSKAMSESPKTMPIPAELVVGDTT